MTDFNKLHNLKEQAELVAIPLFLAIYKKIVADNITAPKYLLSTSKGLLIPTLEDNYQNIFIGLKKLEGMNFSQDYIDNYIAQKAPLQDELILNSLSHFMQKIESGTINQLTNGKLKLSPKGNTNLDKYLIEVVNARLPAKASVDANIAVNNPTEEMREVMLNEDDITSPDDYIDAMVAGGTTSTYVKNPFKKKEWIAILDGKTRNWHVNAYGQEVGFTQAFSVNAEQLMRPSDSSLGASASNICNCRCSVRYF